MATNVSNLEVLLTINGLIKTFDEVYSDQKIKALVCLGKLFLRPKYHKQLISGDYAVKNFQLINPSISKSWQ